MRINPAVSVLVVVAVVITGIAAAGCLGGGGSSEKIIYWTTMAPKLQKVAIERGDVDGGVSWEPYVSDSIVAGSAKPLLWSGDVWPNHPCCVVAVSRTFAESHPDLVMRTLKAHIEANRWIADALEKKTTDPSNYTMLLEMGAAFSARNITVIEASLQHMTLDYKMTQDFYDYLSIFTQKYLDLKILKQTDLTARGYDSINDFVTNYVDSSYLTGADSKTKSDIIVGSISMAYLTGDLHQFARVVATNRTIFDGTEFEGKNFFEKYGVEITDPLPGGYAVGGDIMDAFKAGVADMGYLGAPPTILKHLTAGVNTMIVAQANSEGSALIVNPTITSISELEGKTIATPGPSSIQQLLFLSIAASNGFTVKLAGT